MTNTGFILTGLTLLGPGLPNAEVRFTTGLNVICGPSDTGKTFIAQCLDFALGAGDRPKTIPETQGYHSVQLALLASDNNESFVLERALRGGNVLLRDSAGAEHILAGSHQSDNEDNISTFLLRLSGLAGKRVRTNQLGTTRALTFRDIARLVIVDEESVISTDSPVLSGQYMNRTADQNAFRFILTGVDDSAVIAKEDPKVVKGRREGKVEILNTLLQRTGEQLAKLKVNSEPKFLTEGLTLIESQFQLTSAELARHQEEVAALEERRRVAWVELRQVQSKADVLLELHSRFELLQKQYISDLRRLDAVAEAGVRLGQMKEERCPVCGARPEHHDSTHRKRHASPEDVAVACEAEAKKLNVLLSDLESTLAANAVEISSLNIALTERQAVLNAISNELQTRLQPRLQQVLQTLKERQELREVYRRAVELNERRHELEVLLVEAQARQKRERIEGPAAVTTGEAEHFSQEVESLLRSWHFPNLGRVTFSEDDQDVVISGRQRKSHGKGVRAITRAAFNLGLLRYCIDTSRPYPLFTLIDSPLVVYREPDHDEDHFPLNVKEAFYRSLASDFADAQVIILENDSPPEDLGNTVSVTSFTGTSYGRGGFIPLRQTIL